MTLTSNSDDSPAAHFQKGQVETVVMETSKILSPQNRDWDTSKWKEGQKQGLLQTLQCSGLQTDSLCLVFIIA